MKHLIYETVHESSGRITVTETNILTGECMTAHPPSATAAARLVDTLRKTAEKFPRPSVVSSVVSGPDPNGFYKATVSLFGSVVRDQHLHSEKRAQWWAKATEDQILIEALERRERTLQRLEAALKRVELEKAQWECVGECE